MIGQWLARRRARRIHDAFSAYVSPEVLRKLAENPGELRMGGETRNASVLMGSIPGLVSYTATLKDDPQAGARMVSRVLTPLADAIMDAGGVLQTCAVDRLFAFWDTAVAATDHAARACTAALLVAAVARRMEAELGEEAASQGRTASPLGLAIAVNTGSMVVGHVGSPRLLSYTITGDPALLADSFSRAGPFYGISVIIGAETQRQVPDFATLKVDVVRIVGRPEPEHIHTVVGTPDVAKSAEFQALLDLHQRMLAAYGSRRWDEAAALVRECKAKESWGLVKLYDMYAERIASGAASPSAAP